MNQQSNQWQNFSQGIAQGLAGGISGTQIPQIINEPTVTGRLQQVLDSLALAEQRVSILRGHLFGEGEQGLQQQTPTTLRAIVDNIGMRLASLCGELATVNQRMGCPPEPVTANNQLR